MSNDIVQRLREHATDWNGQQMADGEPAKADPTAGFLREAADRIEALEAEVEKTRGERDEARCEIDYFHNMRRRAEAAEAEVERLKRMNILPLTHRTEKAEAQASRMREALELILTLPEYANAPTVSNIARKALEQ